jgi:hypothetical protein
VTDTLALNNADIALKKWGAQKLAERHAIPVDWRKVRVDYEWSGSGCDTCDYGAGAFLDVSAPGFVTMEVDLHRFRDVLREVFEVEILPEDRT